MIFFKSIALLIAFISTSILAADNMFSEMSDTDKEVTGLNKLSEKEQQALTQWLNGVRQEIIKENKKKNMGFLLEDKEREEIHSNINGEFNGWQGKTLFKLENGQVWKQAERTTFYIPKRNRPKVTIKPKSMGSWMLYVEGYGRGVKVKRIK